MNRSSYLSAAALALLGCSKLTQPPSDQDVFGTATVTAAEPERAEPKAPEPPAAPAPEGKLEIKDLVVGKGAEAKSGDVVSVRYTGTLTDGREFDSSKKHNDTPFEFPLGAGRVIKGWDQGVAGMKVGGKRKLTIPPHLAYGQFGPPGSIIGPNATLVFEVELLEIKGSK